MQTYRGPGQFLLLLLLILTLTVCGRGPNLGTGPTETPSDLPQEITYTGKTTPSLITTTNAGKLMSEIRLFGDRLDHQLLPKKPGEDRLPSRPYLQLYDLVQHIQTTRPDPNIHFSANKPTDTTVKGSCGGEMTIQGNVPDDFTDEDETPGYAIVDEDDADDVQFTSRFNEFCQQDKSGGKATLSGTILFGGDSDNVTMTIPGLTITDKSGGSLSMKGKIDLEIESLGPPFRKTNMTLNLAVRDNGSGKVFKLENYVIDVTESSTGLTLQMSGRFFSPGEGSVELKTNPALFIASGNENPSSGVLVITGNGSQAQLTALSRTEFKLEVDTDGNDGFEFTITELWKTLKTGVS